MEARLWRRFTSGLARTASTLGVGIAGLSRRKRDAATLAELEDLLIEADLGMEAAGRVVQQVGSVRLDQDVSEDEIKELLAAEIERQLAAVARPLALPTAKPAVVLVVGVTGSGKPPPMGKPAARLKAEGKRVLIA